MENRDTNESTWSPVVKHSCAHCCYCYSKQNNIELTTGNVTQWNILPSNSPRVSLDIVEKVNEDLHVLHEIQSCDPDIVIMAEVKVCTTDAPFKIINAQKEDS